MAGLLKQSKRSEMSTEGDAPAMLGKPPDLAEDDWDDTVLEDSPEDLGGWFSVTLSDGLRITIWGRDYKAIQAAFSERWPKRVWVKPLNGLKPRYIVVANIVNINEV